MGGCFDGLLYATYHAQTPVACILGQTAGGQRREVIGRGLISLKSGVHNLHYGGRHHDHDKHRKKK